MNASLEAKGFKVVEMEIDCIVKFALEQDGMLVACYKTEETAIKKAKAILKKYYGIEA